MITQTRSATPLERVTVETVRDATHVWLRRNIVLAEEDGQPVWLADEVQFATPEALTVAQVEEEFGRLWVAHEDDGNPDRLERRIDELSIALAEVVDLVAGGEM